MKALIKLLFAVVACPLVVNGQGIPALDKKYALAISANEIGYDAGVGVEFSTPAFLFHKLRARLKANKAWLECYKAAVDHWATYHSVGASLVYDVVRIERSAVYAEFGAHMLFPGRKFSSAAHIQGLNGLLGADLFIVNTDAINVSYFFSGGVTMATAHAEKLEGSPAYADGFVFSTGFRCYF